METKKIYLAGAMACYGIESNEAKEWREKVKEYFNSYCEYFECVSPVDYYSIGCDISKRDSEVMRFDLRKVREANIILVNLKDLDKSIGTSDEILYAYISGKPIIGFLETDFELKNNEVKHRIHSWKYEQIDRIETGKEALEKACEYIKNFYW